MCRTRRSSDGGGAIYDYDTFYYTILHVQHVSCVHINNSILVFIYWHKENDNPEGVGRITRIQ